MKSIMDTIIRVEMYVFTFEGVIWYHTVKQSLVV